jgi:hypothetical protein
MVYLIIIIYYILYQFDNIYLFYIIGNVLFNILMYVTLFYVIYYIGFLRLFRNYRVVVIAWLWLLDFVIFIIQVDKGDYLVYLLVIEVYYYIFWKNIVVIRIIAQFIVNFNISIIVIVFAFVLDDNFELLNKLFVYIIVHIIMRFNYIYFLYIFNKIFDIIIK